MSRFHLTGPGCDGRTRWYRPRVGCPHARAAPDDRLSRTGEDPGLESRRTVPGNGPGIGAGSICIWELNEPAVRLVRKINRTAATLAWSADGRFLAFEDNGVQIWDFDSGEILVSFGVRGAISRRPWAADSPLLATTSEGAITLWDVARQQPVGTLGEDGVSRSAAIWSWQGSVCGLPQRTVRCECNHSPARRAAGPASFSAEIWDVQKKQRIRSFAIGAGKPPVQLSWSPDAASLVTQLDNETAIWEVNTGTRI